MPVLPPTEESTCASSEVGICTKCMPRRTMPAAKPARSPMTPPPSAMTTSPRSSRAASTPSTTSCRCGKALGLFAGRQRDDGRLRCRAASRLATSASRWRCGDIVVGDDRPRARPAGGARSPRRRARAGRRRSGCRRRGRRAPTSTVSIGRSSPLLARRPRSAMPRCRPSASITSPAMTSLRSSRVGTVTSAAHRPDSARPSASPASARGSAVLAAAGSASWTPAPTARRDRPSARPKRRASAIASRVCAFMKAPPPVDSTCGPLSSRRRMTRCSSARNSGLAIALEQIRDRHARDAFDLVVAVDEGQAEHRRHLAADRRLAGAHQADEDDRARCPAGRAARHGFRRRTCWQRVHVPAVAVFAAYRHEKPVCVKHGGSRMRVARLDLAGLRVP